jgi:hypothetical protein
LLCERRFASFMRKVSRTARFGKRPGPESETAGMERQLGMQSARCCKAAFWLKNDGRPIVSAVFFFDDKG